MAFAIAGLARGNVTIEKEQVVSKSYPAFLADAGRGDKLSAPPSR
jgi:5-enolpyruvylshikimate-3-phosphate synthase